MAFRSRDRLQDELALGRHAHPALLQDVPQLGGCDHGESIAPRHVAASEREAYGERAAVALAAADLDRAAVLLDDLPGCRQADARAANAPGHVAAPSEAVEHTRLVGGRDAKPLV